MPGNKAGGAKAASTNKQRFGEDYYKVIGAKGGTAKRSKPAGFAADRARAKWAGKIGGTVSRRGRA